MNPLASYWGLIKNGLLIGVLVWLGLFCRSCGKEAGENEVRELKLQHAEQTARVARLAQDAAEKARKAEHAWGDAFVAVALKYQRDLSNAQVTEKDVAAAVRAGTLQLRDHWRCPAVPRPPEAPAAAGRADAAAERRAADAGAAVRLAAEFDAYQRLCAQTLTAERQ